MLAWFYFNRLEAVLKGISILVGLIDRLRLCSPSGALSTIWSVLATHSVLGRLIGAIEGVKWALVVLFAPALTILPLELQPVFAIVVELVENKEMDEGSLWQPCLLPLQTVWLRDRI